MQLQALARASLDENLGPRFKRVDLQLIAMIDAAREKLAAELPELPPVRSRVLMTGFSASGAFTNRFDMLHPQRVLAAAAGSPGGWPIAPVRVDQGDHLSYPVGIDDVEVLTGQPIDLAALRDVRFCSYLATPMTITLCRSATAFRMTIKGSFSAGSAKRLSQDGGLPSGSTTSLG